MLLLVLSTSLLLFVLCCCQGLPKGRLLAYYPHNKTTHVISHEFYYSNGVAVSADGTYAAVCETDRLRVLK
jgi:sugar lactone lactonase YvrE